MSTDTTEFSAIPPHQALGVVIDPPITPEESAIVDTAMTILPHLGPDATVAYLARASESKGNEHEA